MNILNKNTILNKIKIKIKYEIFKSLIFYFEIKTDIFE